MGPSYSKFFPTNLTTLRGRAIITLSEYRQMSRYYERNDSGYTRGGLDVVTGINLFFKGILIFPILVLATFVGLTMVKFVLFQGLPTMSQPSEEQRQQINNRDREISQRFGHCLHLTAGRFQFV